jgi:hypothetical protein
MRGSVRAATLAMMGLAGHPALGQKAGGVFNVYHHDSPASMSIHEEATWSVEAPLMAVCASRQSRRRRAPNQPVIIETIDKITGRNFRVVSEVRSPLLYSSGTN